MDKVDEDKQKAEQVKLLMAHAQQNGLQPEDLDDLVHDLKSEEASDFNNEHGTEETDDEIHDQKSEEASNINNSGLFDQLLYIIECLGPTEAMTKIDEIIKGD